MGVADEGGEASTGAVDGARVEALLTGKAKNFGGFEGTRLTLEEGEEPGSAGVEDGGLDGKGGRFAPIQADGVRRPGGVGGKGLAIQGDELEGERRGKWAEVGFEDTQAAPGILAEGLVLRIWRGEGGIPKGIRNAHFIRN